MRKQKRFSAHFGRETGNIFIYDYNRKYIVDMKQGSVKKIYGVEGKSLSTEIQAYKAGEPIEAPGIKVSDKKEDQIGFVLDYVRSLIRKGDRKTLSISEIVFACKQQDICEDIVRACIRQLSHKGEIFLMDNDTISSIHLFKG